MSNIVTLNNVEYIRADSISQAKPNGNRAVVVTELFAFIDELEAQ